MTKLNWRTLSKEEQEQLMWKSICKLSLRQLVDVANICPGDLRDDIMEYASESDEEFSGTMDYIEELLGDRFLD